jgi:hypothetical protein
MPELKPKPLSVYIYLDVEGIESLYAQTTDRVEVELTSSHSKEGHGGIKLKAGFGNLLTTLLGLKEASAATTLETVHGEIEAAKARLSVEHKLQRLTEFLSARKECIGDLRTALGKAEVGRPIFVQVETKFDTPDFFPGGGGPVAINSSGAMVFRIDDHYDPSDQYFKNPHVDLVMTASLKKFPRLKEGMGSTSHEAVFFRGFAGKAIPLDVFGYLIRLNSKACQIKPYAIWLPGGLAQRLNRPG